MLLVGDWLDRWTVIGAVRLFDDLSASYVIRQLNVRIEHTRELLPATLCDVKIWR